MHNDRKFVQREEFWMRVSFNILLKIWVASSSLESDKKRYKERKNAF